MFASKPCKCGKLPQYGSRSCSSCLEAREKELAEKRRERDRQRYQRKSESISCGTREVFS